MKKIALLLSLSIALMLAISSCKKDNSSAPVNLGYSYYPDTVGLTRIYQADSIFWDDFNGRHDTIHFQIKEIIDSAFYDLSNRLTYRVERYKLDANTGQWVIYRVWSSTLTATGAERTEENERYLKLVFPVKRGTKWNGNTFNTQDQQDYKYTQVNSSGSVNTLTFDSTMTVLQADDDNLVEKIYDEERYAAGVGLFYRQNTHLQYNFPLDEVKSGYIYTETLLSYSNTP